MFKDSSGRLQPIAAFLLSAVLSALAFLVAGYVAEAIAGERYLVLELIFRALLVVLLVAIFVWLLTVADGVEDHRISRLGLPHCQGWLKQFTTGCLVGLALTILAVGPLMVWGSTRTAMRVSLHTLPRAGAVLAVLLLGALAEELLFRGYPFQHLEKGIGALSAIAVFSVLFAAAHLANPDASMWGLVNTVLIGIVLAVAYLRTRALWLPWGIHFGWNTALGFCFGLPVSGIRLFNAVIRTTATGPKWITGGSYGVEASVPGTVAVLVGLVVVWKLPVAKLGEDVLPRPESDYRDSLPGIQM